MAKEWTKLNTVNDPPKTHKTEQEKNRENRLRDNFIRATKSLNKDELKKQGELHHAQKLSADAALLDAFENKKLKSKELIKQAMVLKKAKEKKAAATASKDPQPTPAE